MIVFAALAVFYGHAGAKLAVPPFKLGHTRTMDTPAVLAVAPAPTGSRIAVTFDDNSVRIYDAATGKKIKVLRGHPQPAYGLAWSPDGAFLASGDESARIFVWNVATGQRVEQFRTHTKGIENLSFNRQHNLLLSTGRDDYIKIYNLNLKKEVASFPGNGANFYGARFDPYLNNFATANLSNGGMIYKVNGVPIRFLDGHGGQGALDIDYNPSGTEVITAGKDGTAIVWNVKTGKRVGTLRGHEDLVLKVAFAPSGTVAATSSDDRTVRVWNTVTMKQIGEVENESSVGSPIKFTSDGKFLISSNVNDQLQVTPITPAQTGTASKAAKAPKRHYRRRR